MTLILWYSESEYIKASHEYETKEQIRFKTGLLFGHPACNILNRHKFLLLIIIQNPKSPEAWHPEHSKVSQVRCRVKQQKKEK